MNQERPSDVLIAAAGSLYTLFLHYATVIWAWVPSVLTSTYVIIKIYCKIKRERVFWKERALRLKWESETEDD